MSGRDLSSIIGYLAVVSIFGGCGGHPPQQYSEVSKIESKRARTLGDRTGQYLMTGDRDNLKATFISEVRSLPISQFNSSLDEVLEHYGQPIELQFKSEEILTGAQDPVSRIWYAMRTTKHDKWSHFLIIDIVVEDNDLAVSRFSIVDFPHGIPEFLR
jgi:hypothetical protein